MLIRIPQIPDRLSLFSMRPIFAMLPLPEPYLGWLRRPTGNDDLLKFRDSNKNVWSFLTLNDDSEVFIIDKAYCHTRTSLRTCTGITTEIPRDIYPCTNSWHQ